MREELFSQNDPNQKSKLRDKMEASHQTGSGMSEFRLRSNADSYILIIWSESIIEDSMTLPAK